MLRDIKIKDFALLKKASLNLKDGLNVITGQTGAGKSILVGALSMVLGERVGREIVRDGAKFCEVEAEYGEKLNSEIKSFLKDRELGTDVLILRRKFYARGRSRCYINDHHVTVRCLKELGNLLVDIHSQNEHQTLLKHKKQREILDRFSGARKLVGKLGKIWEKYINLQEEIKNRKAEVSRINSEIDRLRHEAEEIDFVKLKKGMEEELEKEYRILSNAEFIQQTAKELSAVLYENDEAIIEKLSHILSRAEEISSIDENFSGLSEMLEDTVYKVETVYEELRSYLATNDFNPHRLKEIADKRDKIIDLKRKYGPEIEDIIDYREMIDNKLKNFNNSEKDIKKMNEKLNSYLDELKNIADRVTEKRKEGAEKLSGDIEKKLKKLGMESAEFNVKLKSKEVGPTGKETVRFFIKPNPGEPDMKLSKVASGGEVSRIMLAIKSSLAHSDNIPILIFDEIDTGIGATVGKAVGEEIKTLSEYHQVITISHLPQIAEKADNHIKVIKKSSGDRTRTEIKLLDGESREKEIKRLYGGKVKTA
ncbi:MAG: DNA repair protein RecN [Elusimicrobiota bacterium]